MSERRSIADMLGEFFREAALLVMVLGPLERIVMDATLTLQFFGAIVGVSVSALAVGIGIERWRMN